MSATSPIVKLNATGPTTKVAMQSRLARFYFQKRVFRSGAILAFGLSFVLVLVSIAGLADYVWNFSRALRIGLLALLVACTVTVLSYAVFSMIRRQKLVAIARDIERAASRSDNAIMTFVEKFESTSAEAQDSYMIARLERQAQRSLAGIDINAVVPRRYAVRGAGLLALVTIFLFALRLIVPTAFAREWRRIVFVEPNQSTNLSTSAGTVSESGNNFVTIERFVVRVVPPAYSGLPIEESGVDAPLRVLAGSRFEIDMTARGRIATATLGFAGATNQMRPLAEGVFGGSFVANTSGAFEARITPEQAQSPISIVRAIEVYNDSAPDARIEQPTSDQLLRAVPVTPVSVQWTARDDLGLSNVVLKYIRSRGEGDSAQFVSGTLPLAGVDRASSNEWSGNASISLTKLGIQPGDTLVYWIEARDRNPNENSIGRSVSLAIAITSPEPVKLNLGDLGPTEIGRFLLSQRMIILSTESLHSKRTRLPRDEFLRQANSIAADQRDFKNSFNEYMKLEGGSDGNQAASSTSNESIEERVRESDEERTGVHMHGIPEPPAGAPSNVRDMVYAIRAMWDAENALTVGDTAKALVHEREALTRLKRAQLAVRYVPPVFARSKPIDLKRRYTGELNEIKTRMERLPRTPESKESTFLRAALTDAYGALAELRSSLDVSLAARASAIARANDRVRQSANRLSGVGGEHAATIAESLGQLRIVETELSQVDTGGTAEDYATRMGRVLSLLTKATANLFAVAEARTRAGSGGAEMVLPADKRRTSEYFRRLNK